MDFAGAGASAPAYETSLALTGFSRAAAIDVANDIAYWCMKGPGSDITVYKVDLKSATDATPAVIGTPLTVTGTGSTPGSIALDLADG